MGHIFISYARRDTAFVERMYAELRKHDLEAWTDNVLSPGSDWRQEIDEAIRTAFALVVIVTPESKTSEYVTYEWAFALGIGIRVVPLILKPTQLHPRLEFFQHVDFVHYEGDDYPWQRLLDGLQRIREETRRGAVPARYNLAELGTTSMDAPGMWLQVERGPQPGQMWNLNRTVVTVGREITNDIVINDQQVSRRHLRFVRNAQGHFVTFTIEDLESSNGTYVNEQRLNAPRVLDDGDLIRLGDSISLVYKVIMGTG